MWQINGSTPLVRDDHDPRPCVPCGVFASWKPQRSGAHNLRLRMQKLDSISYNTMPEVYVKTYASHQCGCTCVSGASLVA
jgi:hypothetical protein